MVMVSNTITVQFLVTYMAVGCLRMSLLVFICKYPWLVLLHFFYALTGQLLKTQQHVVDTQLAVKHLQFIPATVMGTYEVVTT